MIVENWKTTEGQKSIKWGKNSSAQIIKDEHVLKGLISGNKPVFGLFPTKKFQLEACTVF